MAVPKLPQAKEAPCKVLVGCVPDHLKINRSFSGGYQKKYTGNSFGRTAAYTTVSSGFVAVGMVAGAGRATKVKLRRT